MHEPLTRLGGVHKYASRGVGDVPMNKLYVQPDHSLGPEATRYIAMLPTVHNFDSFAYDLRVFNGEARPRESWAMLFDPRAKGRLALVDEPAIGLLDAALAAEAIGALHFENIGQRFVEAFGPEMLAAFRVDELDIDAHAAGVALDRALEHVAYTKLRADLPRVDVLAFESEGGVAGDHEGAAEARQVGGQVLRDSVGEIILGRVV